MSYVDTQLVPGETVRYRAHLHKMMFAAPAALGIVALASIPAVMADVRFWPLPVIWTILAAIALLWCSILYNGSEFAVTDKRVIVKVGWIRRRTLETMLSKIEGIGVDQGLLGRMLSFGTIVVTGTGGTHEQFNNIANPLEFRRQVQAAIAEHEYTRPMTAAAMGERVERECPFCAEMILARAKVCKHCGRDVA